MQQNIIVESNNKSYSVPKDIFRDPTRSHGNRMPPEMRKSFQLAEVHELHHEIARLLVLGHKPKEVAKLLNVSYATVINVKNSPVIQEQMNLLGGARDKETKDVAKQIRDLAPKAVQILEGVLEDAEGQIGKALQVKTSLAILDRAGHSVPKNVNVKGVHAVVSAEDLERIKARGAEIGIYEEEDSEVIDV